MRFGDYEVLPCNQWCYQVYRVMPEGYGDGIEKYNRADDGRVLRAIECYPTTLAEACRKIAEFADRDGGTAGDALEVEKRLRVLYDQISDAAQRLTALQTQKEAAR